MRRGMSTTKSGKQNRKSHRSSLDDTVTHSAMGGLGDFLVTLVQLVTLVPAAAIGLVLHVLTSVLDCAS